VLTVRPSSIAGAGVGVFTLRPVTANTIVGYFNGVHRHRQDVFQGERSAYLVEGSHPNELLDIPDWARAWHQYSASAGHLINHAEEGNVDYTDCWHPRCRWHQSGDICPAGLGEYCVYRPTGTYRRAPSCLSNTT
jgi:hypothetical protein